MVAGEAPVLALELDALELVAEAAPHGAAEQKLRVKMR